MKLVALDLALTTTGWAALNGSPTPALGVIKPRGRGVKRLADGLTQVRDLAADAAAVILEGYSYSSRNSQAHSLGELGGVVKLGLHIRGVKLVIVPPSSLKKVATGKGNASKELVLVEAVKRLGYQGADNNIADALWLLVMAQIHYGLPGAPELPKKHLEGMQKVEWPELG